MFSIVYPKKDNAKKENCLSKEVLLWYPVKINLTPRPPAKEKWRKNYPILVISKMPQSCESSKTTQVLHCCSALVSSSATFRVGMFCGFFCPHYRREFERHHRRELNEINTAGEAPPSAFFPWFSVSTASLPPFRLPGWWVEYINFSTSATICLLG